MKLGSMTTIHINDLRAQTIIGTNKEERAAKQDIIINITIEFDAAKAARSDDLNETIDYQTLAKRILQSVENSRFFLLEKLTTHVLDIIMEDKGILAATVRIDKPHALNFAKSVSVKMSRCFKH